MNSRKVRIDRRLWAVRVFRTRSAAIEACRAGHVKICGERVKPAREVRVGEVLSVQIGVVTRTLKVLALLERRVGAKQVPAHLEDLTPPDELAMPRRPAPSSGLVWTPGQGRPTKRDRRLLEKFLDLPTDTESDH
jgi:ribosome-associated heat shock protein Hsp15